MEARYQPIPPDQAQQPEELEGKARLSAYLDEIGALLRNKPQRALFAQYALGLLNDGERKSMEPMAARLGSDPHDVQKLHFRIQHFISSAHWNDGLIREYATKYAVAAMQEQSPIKTWIVDDTGMLKQGKFSPGVQRQYTGTAGKTTNCQIAVSLLLSNNSAHVKADARLYIPESWTVDRERCRRAHIPDDIVYEPKWALALSMIEQAVQSGLPKGVVLADAGYGNTTAFRDTLTQLDLQYAVGIQSTTKVRYRNNHGEWSPRITVEDLGWQLQHKFRRITWREGTKGKLSSRFARIRVVVEREDGVERDHEWLLVEWPDGESGPTKFVLSTLPKNISCKKLVRTTKERWRIERSYEDLKGELGFDHYEGRSFIGWHHHVTLALTCYAFLVAELVRSFFPSTRRAQGHGPFEHAA